MTFTDYVSRKGGGSGLTSIKDSVDALVHRLEDFIEKRRGRLTTATRNNTDNTRNNRTEITRKEKWKEKQLHKRFKGLKIDFSHEKTRTLLKKKAIR